MKTKFIPWLLLTLVLLSCGCSKKKTGAGAEATDNHSPVFTLHGTTALPAPFAVYELFDSAQGYAGVSRFSCPAQGNGSLLKGPTIVLQTMGNCSDKQWIYFYKTDPIDLSAFAQGSVEVRLQATGGTMGISAYIEDDAAKVSTAVDLATVGFDKSKTGIEQKVVIPVSSFGAKSVDLSKVKRLLQLEVTCATTNCYLSIFSIRWLGPQKVPTALTSTHCDPFACHTLPHATHRIYVPTSHGWSATSVDAGITDAEGAYSLGLTRSRLLELMKDGNPLLLAIAEDGGVYTFSVMLSLDDLNADSVQLDTSLASTIASKLVCPGGRFPPPSGAYCYAPTAQQRSDLQDAIDAYLVAHPLSDADLVALTEAAAADPGVTTALKAVITDASITVTSQTIKDNEGANPVPPPNDGLATASTLPTNLPAGSYLFAAEVCGAGTCQNSSHTVTVTSATATTITDQIKSAFQQTSLDCGAQGVTCQDRYSGFNGVSFTAARFIQACTDGVCATASVSIKLTLQ